MDGVTLPGPFERDFDVEQELRLEVSINRTAVFDGVERELTASVINPKENPIIANAKLLQALEVIRHVAEKGAK